MKKERKEELLHCFPPVPRDIENQMQGRGAANFCVFLTYGHELFVRCFHRYTGGRLIERQRYVFAKDGAVRYIFNEWLTPAWRVATKFKEPRFAAEYCPYGFDNTYVILNADAYRQSDMKYCQLQSEHFCCPIMYLRLYTRHPNVEYLIKSGYGFLIEDEARDYYGNDMTVTVYWRVDLRSNNLLKMLGLNRTEFKLLRENERLYPDYMQYRDDFPKYKPQELLEIAKAYRSEHGALDSHENTSGFSPLRLARYLNAQGIDPTMYSD